MVLNVNHSSLLFAWKDSCRWGTAERAVLNITVISSTGFASLLKKKGGGGGEKELGKTIRLYLYVKIHYLHVIEK